MNSPVGPLRLFASGKGLAGILWQNDDRRRFRLDPGFEDKSHPVLRETERQLKEYFSGRGRAFSVPLDFHGTPFQ
ncbi:MAG: cysteine methyltransferase, partial [Rhodospirillaceae bacterium]